jgi:hypothetical protein
MEITRADDKSAEGKFYFTATSSGTDKITEVTDGFSEYCHCWSNSFDY